MQVCVSRLSFDRGKLVPRLVFVLNAKLGCEQDVVDIFQKV